LSKAMFHQVPSPPLAKKNLKIKQNTFFNIMKRDDKIYKVQWDDMRRNKIT
jgi:hypothetical protein